MTYGFCVAWCLCAFVLDYTPRVTPTQRRKGITYTLFVAWCLCAFVLHYSPRGMQALVQEEER